MPIARDSYVWSVSDSRRRNDRQRQDFCRCGARYLLRFPEEVGGARVQIICECVLFLHDDNTDQGVDCDVQLWQVGLNQYLAGAYWEQVAASHSLGRHVGQTPRLRW